ncbi:MAG TPA: hypothetical protein VM582_01300 [Candidatus Thermoplasmatota archaeon]|nr:hypothetical protein [Candidatus Thermoplasmatota archaeon]
MHTAVADEPAFPEDVRRRSAHVLASLLVIQGVAAGGGLLWLVVAESRDPMGGLPLFFLLVAVLSFLAAGLEWMRQRSAEMVATIALLASFGLTLAAVLAGVWYLVPFVGLATIIAIFGLVDRFAVRDEARHAQRP